MKQNSTSAKVTLTVTKGNLKGQTFQFQDRTTSLIGRAKDCNPQLPNDEAHITISRYQCFLDINPPDVRIRDFGSKNGTYVNGKNIGQRQEDQTPEEGRKMNFPEYDLQDGDVIGLGNTVFQVTLEGAKKQIDRNTLQAKKSQMLALINQLLKQAAAGDKNLVAIKGYKIVDKLGEGGFGEVYSAINTDTGELVALKVMLPQVAAEPDNIKMFLGEINKTKLLKHPNVVKLLDYGHSSGTFFFTLEYCEGGTLWDFMQQQGGKMSLHEAIPIILQVLDGLEYAHNLEFGVKLADGTVGKVKGLVHRDIKPSNIFLTQEDNKTIAKIGDYGLAKAFDLAGLSGQTMTGTTGGTLCYMPRQQVINFKYVQPEVDVWAAAACLYHMLTGVFPRDFQGRDPFVVVLRSDAVPISQRSGSIPKKLAKVIDLALQDNPEIYFKTAADLKQEILKAIS